MSAGRPGPWSAYDETNIDGKWAVVGREFYVAACYQPNAEANARLIAAAPELLEALQALLATHKQGRGQCCEAADKAIDAIAKALGKPAFERGEVL